MDGFDPATGEVAPLEYRSTADLGELFGALSKAQGSIRNATKDAQNPHFKSRYADLASIADACRDALSANGIAVLQIPFNDGQDVGVVTRLGHASGQWIEGRLKVAPAKWDAQGLGSVITYCRRYCLAAMAGVAPGDDDDGEAAVGRGPANGAQAPLQAPANRTRKASPVVSEEEAAIRGLADGIKMAIDDAPTLEGLNAVMENRGQDPTHRDPLPTSDLGRVKAWSESAYRFLIDRADKKRGTFLASPERAA